MHHGRCGPRGLTQSPYRITSQATGFFWPVIMIASHTARRIRGKTFSKHGVCRIEIPRENSSDQLSGVTLNETLITLPTRLRGSQLPASADDVGVKIHRHGSFSYGRFPAQADLDLADRSHGIAGHDWAVCESFDLIHDESEHAVAVGVSAVS